MKQILPLVSLITLFFISCDTQNSVQSDEILNEHRYAAFNKPKLDEFLDLLYQNDKFMGTVSLVYEDSLIYSRAVGFADIENQKALTAETKYRLGSISKMFTATLIFKAIEENKLDIDQTIEKYFPAIENSSIITISHLLNHRSGIQSFTKDKTFHEYRTEYKSPKEMVEIISKYKSEFAPDSKGSYSNSNYLLLTVLLEKVYDKSFNELISEKIFTPLSLKNTYFGDGIGRLGNETNSYQYTTEWVKETATNLSIPMGAGSIVSTPNDLNLFIRALFNEKIISKESLDMMTTIKDAYGMGLMQFSHSNLIGFGHGGNIEGFNAISIYFPKEKLALAIASNAVNYNMNSIVTDVLKCYFNEPFEMPVFDAIEISQNELEKYVGVYSGESLPGKFTITIENSTLFAQLNDLPKEPLVYKGNNMFTNEEIGANFIFNLQENRLGLEQSGVDEIYMYSKQ